TRASFGEASFEALLRSAQAPSCGEHVGHVEADVVRRAGVLAAGIAEPDDQPVDSSATATEGASQRAYSPPEESSEPASSELPSAASPTSSVSDSISSSASVCRRGGDRVATTVSSRSSSSETPSGIATSASPI